MRSLTKRLLLALIAIVGLSLPALAQQTQRFEQPRFQGIPVDHCETWASNCGRGGADGFCQRAGFQGAVDWDTYNPGRTYVLGSNRQCNGGSCTGLRGVTCTNAAGYRNAKKINRPTYRGLAVDHCATFANNCGQGGADLVCQGEGLGEALAWKTFNAGRTYVIGSNRRCTGGDCTGLRSVTCAAVAQAIPYPAPLPYPEPAPTGGQRFDYPSAAGLPIDHCETFARNCGRGGADQFCRGEGFAAAESWETYTPGQSYVIGSNRRCTSGNCTAFSSVSCVNTAVAPLPAPGPSRTFNRPSVSGLVVDHCETFGRNCGRGGADALCRTQGFTNASDWKTFKPGATWVVGSNRRCNGPSCTGFRSVSCETSAAIIDPYNPTPGPLPSEGQTFESPRYAGLPVDHCRRFGQDCGRGGAEEFCRQAGFETATNWQTYQAGRTYVIGSNRECTGGNCTGLSSVTCQGSAGYGGYQPDPLPPTPAPASQRFDYPTTEQGLYIDQCPRAGKRCGKGGARRFCRSQGFERAIDWSTFNAGTTYHIGSERRCSGPNCVGLASVTCGN